MIEAKGIIHHYGIRPVLRDVSVNIGDGEIVAVMGPNGMGKSTLVGVLAGQLWPVKGTVRVNGLLRRESETTELAIRQQIAYLPADPWLPRFRTGRDWLLAVGRVYGVDDDRLLNHAERLLDVFDLTKRADSLISAFSTGQRKKIAICAALATDAPILLLDEPFAGGLDPSGILALKRILQSEHVARAKTVVMATPVPELVEELADRVVIITEGKIAVDDTVEKIKLTAGAATLADAYDRLVSPKMLEKIERYLREDAR